MFYDYSKSCTCNSSCNTPVDFPYLQTLLPKWNDKKSTRYQYSVCDYDAAPDSETVQFCSRFRVNCFSKEDAKQWFDDFSKLSKVTFRLEKTFLGSSAKIVYKVSYRCQHNTKPANHKVCNPHEKHTGCPAKLGLTVKQPNMEVGSRNRPSRSKDVHLPHLPMVVILRHMHNHSIHEVDALKYRTPNQSLVNKFHQLFQYGYTPSKSLEIHQQDLLAEHRENYPLVIADRSECPDIQWVFYQYRKAKSLGLINTDATVTLDTRVDSSNEDDGISDDDAGSSNEGNKENPEMRVKKAHAALDEVLQDLKELGTEDPSMLEAFVANYKRLNTPASISSACQSFGKQTDLSTTSSTLQNDSSCTTVQQIVPVQQQIVPVRAFECKVCRKLFSNEEGLKEHTLLHVGESLIICEVCGEKFIYQSGLRQHMVSKHGIERCYLCDLVLGSKKDLLVHMQSHFGERAKSFLCHECGNFYCDAAELQNHMETHNARRRNFACDVCKKRFQTKSSLAAHVNHFHKNENEITELRCSVCNKKFFLKSNLLRHVRTHQERHSLKMRK